MKKSEMEEHRSEYQRRMGLAHVAEDEGMYRAAIQAAVDAWENIDGLIQYARKFESREVTQFSAIDYVLKYAPLLLDRKPLIELERYLENFRRREKGFLTKSGEMLDHARSLLWQNHLLWDYLEKHPDTRQDQLRQILSGDQDHWRWAAEAWEKMGLLNRTPDSGNYRLALSTRMGQLVRAKCPSCGEVSEAPKGMLLEKTACPQCGKTVFFVLLRWSADSGIKD